MKTLEIKEKYYQQVKDYYEGISLLESIKENIENNSLFFIISESENEILFKYNNGLTYSLIKRKDLKHVLTIKDNIEEQHHSIYVLFFKEGSGKHIKKFDELKLFCQAIDGIITKK